VEVDGVRNAGNPVAFTFLIMIRSIQDSIHPNDVVEGKAKNAIDALSQRSLLVVTAMTCVFRSASILRKMFTVSTNQQPSDAY